MIEIALLLAALLAAFAVRRRWPVSLPLRRAAAWLWAWARSNPAAAGLWALVVLHAIMVAELPGPLRDEVLRVHSTNPQQLSQHPLSALLTSALWIEPSDVPFITLLVLLVIAPAERWLGTGRAIVAFFVGHVLASRLIAPGLLGDPELRHVVDVGISYGGLCLAGLLTYRIRSVAWRIAAMAGLLAVVGLSGTFFDWWTGDGHLVAVLIGFALWPLTRAAATRTDEPWVQPAGYAALRVPRVSARTRRIALCALFAVAAVVYVWRPGTAVETGIRDYRVTEAVSALRVASDGGRIEVVVGAPGVVKVTETLVHDRARPKTSHTVSATGELVLRSGGCGFSIVAWFDKERCSVNYRIEVPPTLAVRLRSDGGQIVLTGLAGPTDVVADGGSILATGLRSATFTAKTDGGTLDARFAAIPDLVDLRGDGGSVAVRLPDAAYAVDAAGGSQGNRLEVTVRVDPSSPHRITAHSAGSTVSITPADRP